MPGVETLFATPSLAYAMVFLAAIGVSFLLTPVTRRIALLFNLVDHPSDRKVHTAPVPYLGGVAIVLSFALAMLIYGWAFYLAQLIVIVAGGLLVSLVGLWDDRNGMHPLVKLTGQLLAAIAVALSGVQIQIFPFAWLNFGVTLLWIVGLMNALNFMDNMDGLAAAVTSTCAFFFFLHAAFSGQYLVASLSVALLGASVGFLRHNIKPEWHFMGDAGSLFLGFVLAVVAIKLRFPYNTYLVTALVPLYILAIPLFDMVMVVASRLRQRRPIYLGGKDHISHRLRLLGWSNRAILWTIVLATGALGLLSLPLARFSLWPAYVMTTGLAALFLALLVWLEVVYVRGTRALRQQAMEADASAPVDPSAHHIGLGPGYGPR